MHRNEWASRWVSFMPLAPRLGECGQCGLMTRLACMRACVACACVLVRVCVFVLRPQVWNAVNNLLDDYSHGVVHDFDKPTENATERPLRRMPARAMHIR